MTNVTISHELFLHYSKNQENTQEIAWQGHVHILAQNTVGKHHSPANRHKMKTTTKLTYRLFSYTAKPVLCVHVLMKPLILFISFLIVGCLHLHSLNTANPVYSILLWSVRDEVARWLHTFIPAGYSVFEYHLKWGFLLLACHLACHGTEGVSTQINTRCAEVWSAMPVSNTLHDDAQQKR